MEWFTAKTGECLTNADNFEYIFKTCDLEISSRGLWCAKRHFIMPSYAEILSSEEREYQRYDIFLPGQIFLPEKNDTLDCRVLNLSGGGAGLQCDIPLPLQTFVLLSIDGFGRFDGIITRYAEGELGLRFLCGEARRQRLLDDLMRFVTLGVTVPIRRRGRAGNPAASRGHFTRASGEVVPCEILHIAQQGLSLRTSVQPPVGELVNLGLTFGRIVCHHEHGITIQFLSPTAAPKTVSRGD